VPKSIAASEARVMFDRMNPISVLLSLLLFLIGGQAVQAQTIQFTATDVALKNGESTEIGDVFYISLNCRSLLKGTPTVEIVDGPPGVVAVINPATVVPRSVGCANPVGGGKLVVTARNVEEYSYTRMVLRVIYKTLEGDRQRSVNINITLFPQS
jgi:hypothetical protein